MWTEWQMLVITLPCRNSVADGKDGVIVVDLCIQWRFLIRVQHCAVKNSVKQVFYSIILFKHLV